MADSIQPVLDAEHLARQSMGSEALRVEILSLFVQEVERLLRQVEKARDAQTRKDRLHAILGLSRNVGAANLGHIVRRTEEDPDIMEADLEPLRDAVTEVVGHIRAMG